MREPRDHPRQRKNSAELCSEIEKHTNFFTPHVMMKKQEILYNNESDKISLISLFSVKFEAYFRGIYRKTSHTKENSSES